MVHFRLVRSSDGRIDWHLLSANSRTLARAPGSFDTVGLAVQAVAGLRAMLPAAVSSVSPDGSARWCWSLAGAGGAPLARSARAYHRRVDCNRAVERFRLAAAMAPLEPELFDRHLTRRHER